MMKAIVQETLGGPEVLVLAEVPRPTPGIGQVLIKVRAAGVNPADEHTRRAGIFSVAPPFTPGFDVAGTVVAVGPGVTIHAIGDEVFGMLPFPATTAAGGYAEFALAGARAVVPMPSALDHSEAAALPLAGLTAWQSLSETAHLTAGQRVLISGASGGVGHIAVQVAAALGAHVTALASEANAQRVSAFGANEVLDLRTAGPDDLGDSFDVVLDALGGEFTSRAVGLARAGGTVVSLVPQAVAPAAAAARDRGVRLAGLLVEADRVGLLALSQLVDDGRLRPVVASTHPLADAAAAQTDPHGLGKVVLLVGDPSTR